MKPEINSRRLFGITRSKGKMYEFGLPESMHLDLPERTDPNQLILLTVGTLGDVAADVCEGALPATGLILALSTHVRQAAICWALSATAPCITPAQRHATVTDSASMSLKVWVGSCTESGPRTGG